jgi:hypothetical protein
MATFYKYAERNAQSQINWAEVGRNITDTLREEAKLREEKIATIDENTRQLGLNLQDNPQGEHEGLNQWSLDYAANAQQMRLIQDRLLKSGQLKVSDYTKMRQNLSDGTDGIFAALEEYQTEYADKMERYRNGESQPLEQWTMAQAEGLANFSTHKPVIDSMSSEVFIAKIENGKMDTNPNNYVSVSTLRNRIKGKFDKFKTDDYAEKIASGFGVETLEVAKKMGTTWGKIISKEGVRGTVNPKDQAAIDAYNIAENAAVSSALTNPYNFTSILSDNGYSFTFDPKEAQSNNKLILLKNDPKNGYPVPDTGATNYKNQMGEADKLLRNIIRSKMDKKTEEKTFGITQATSRQTDLASRRAGSVADQNVSMIGRLYTGQDLQTALTYFRDRLGAKSIVRDGSNVIVKKENGEIVKLPFMDSNGNPMAQEKFIESAAALLLTDKNESADTRRLAMTGGISQGKFSSTASGEAKVEKQKTSIDYFNEKVDAIQLKSDDKYPTEEELKEKLNNEFANSGFVFDWTYFDGEQIEVKNTMDKTSKATKFPINDEGMRNMKQFIKANMKSALINKDTQGNASGYLGTIKGSKQDDNESKIGEGQLESYVEFTN